MMPQYKPKTVHIRTYGCQMNVYDSDKIADLLQESHGLTRIDTPEDADVLLMNTCSIREKAQEKVFSQLGVWRRFHKNGIRPIVGVGGCVASQEGDLIRKRAPYVDIIFGPQTLHRLPSMLDHILTGRGKGEKTHAVDVRFPEIEKFDCLPEPKAHGATAFVSIQEGCSKYCSFCVVPYTRGEEISRPLHQVLDEVQALTAQGVCEITLLGQNVNAWRGALPDGSIGDFALLLSCIADIDAVQRIRYTTSHPLEWNESLIDAHAHIDKLAQHVHLPVQHGSDRMLTTMKRRHTAVEYKQIIRDLRAVRPDIAISSDFIVGFPGETDEDFADMLDLVHTVRFDKSFSFLYSPRPGTPAADIPNETPLSIRKERLRILQDALNTLAAGYTAAMQDTMQRVVVTERLMDTQGVLLGRTDNMRHVCISGDAPLGACIHARITETTATPLKGVLL